MLRIFMLDLIVHVGLSKGDAELWQFIMDATHPDNQVLWTWEAIANHTVQEWPNG